MTLSDDVSRREAIAALDRSLLVEAGAGSGKTAVMAARIVMLLAAGVAPRRIAAVTFTELAASELLVRVREFAAMLQSDPGRPPAEMRVALPAGLDPRQRAHIEAASHALDEMTCSTIHGFCQRLIQPYPVEADIDPGATLMDRDQADLSYREIAEAWLREALAGGETLLTALALRAPDQTIALAMRLLDLLRQHRQATARPVRPLAPCIAAFQASCAAFSDFMRECAESAEEETAGLAADFAALAHALPGLDTTRPGDAAPAQLATLLFIRPGRPLVTAGGKFAAFRKKTKWQASARAAGLSKADGDLLSERAREHYLACCATWEALCCQTASHVLAGLIAMLRPVADRFRAYKRAAGLLDFDDLIHAARDLLRDHEPVRRALADRYTHVLVDEFQDTDPLQSEIFWRLCGDPVPQAGAVGEDWAGFRIRSGALFLVGDPKQAIYRFRGADVAAYVQARSAFAAQDSGSVLSISTNFRSRAPILDFVNDRFASLLSMEGGQPGFTALEAFHAGGEGQARVVALDVAVGDAGGNASAEQQRDAEAEAVADLCARLIGNEMVPDRRSGAMRSCRPGDIALLAPTGSDLWRYEEALERRGVPVATQAGKGLYRRQEIQDLIALTRVLADPADTLALGALLRGPLVGLSEEELLDIVGGLPRDDGDEALPRLGLGADPAHIAHPHARDVLAKLRPLRGKANVTTPHDLLAQAVDVMRVRAVVQQRHRGQAARALANIDLYLDMARAYAVRGLRAFGIAMTEAWNDEARAPEGRPDAQEEAVALFTMHAAKGLEWPIVLPINTMTLARAADSTLVDRASGFVYCPVFGLMPEGLEAARGAEQDELGRERIRLWYVAATRAREMLVLPRLDVEMKDSAWMALPRLGLASLPAFDLKDREPRPLVPAAGALAAQTRERFVDEAARIAATHRPICWIAPSRGEDRDAPLRTAADASGMGVGLEDLPPSDPAAVVVQGGRERGLLIHKLLEEVLNGEVGDDPAALAARAGELIAMLGLPDIEDPKRGVSAQEIAQCAARTLSLPDIATIRHALVPEYGLLSATVAPGGPETIVAGIADAIAFGPDGRPDVVVDWKSDVAPTRETIEHYRAQVGQYLAMTGATRGLIVLVTPGRVVEVLRLN